jgi:hypothetical protein
MYFAFKICFVFFIKIKLTTFSTFSFVLCSVYFCVEEDFLITEMGVSNEAKKYSSEVFA